MLRPQPHARAVIKSQPAARLLSSHTLRPSRRQMRSTRSLPHPSAGSAVSRATGTAAGTRAAPRPRSPAGLQPPPTAVARGLQVSPCHVLQDLLLQRGFRDQPLKPRVLFLEFLEPLALLELEPAVFLAPPIIGLLGDPRLPARLRRGLAVWLTPPPSAAAPSRPPPLYTSASPSSDPPVPPSTNPSAGTKLPRHS
jgi:hypothetical protein